MRLLASILLLLSLPLSALAQSAEAAAGEVTRLRSSLTELENRLQVVEKQYVYRQDPSEEEELKRRYNDGEIQFLLNNYQAASVLFYDLIGSPVFRQAREYPDSLYMLAESLYQEQNFLGARLYFREHMNQRGSHYRDALGRYLEISGRINEFSGIDQYIEKAKGPSGALPADVAYVYAKWLFRRTDIPDRDRKDRAWEVFEAIAEAGGAYAMQSFYFLGVLSIQKGDLAGAIPYFERVLKLPAKDVREKRVHEMANLSLGRVLFELGKYTEALDRYQEIDYKSDNFVDALYEIAWTHVRKAKDSGPEEYEKANQACEKLLLAAPDSVVAPEARILQGHLLLKLGKYQEATDAYTSIINTYLEVYDNIDGRLKAHDDPVKYLQKVIAESGKTFDISAFLPPIAVKWATTQKDVAEAVRMTGDLDASKKGVADSNEIAGRLLDLLDKRELDIFPTFQEGLSRAEAVDSALAKLDADLLGVEKRLVGAQRLAKIEAELAAVQQERAGLEERFKNLPKSESELAERKHRMAERITELDQSAFRLSYQTESLYALLAALEKFYGDTREQRTPDAESDREFAERMRQEREVANQLAEELKLLQRKMRDEKAKLGLLGNADAELRARYEQVMERERSLLASVRSDLGADAVAVLREVDAARQSMSAMRARTGTAKEKIREAVRRKSNVIRQKVQAESERLTSYDEEVKKVAGSAQNLVGAIAYDSFLRVRRQFYELVLKADVGLVDVAWTRKQDKTNQIQGLAKQKDRELKGLDDEFKEVLKEVE